MPEISWWGHATATIEDSGIRILTDPVLTSTVGHLHRRRGPLPTAAALSADAVVVSHLHGDHLHVRSLLRLAPAIPIILPRGALRAVRGLRRLSKRDLVEVSPGDRIQIGPVLVEAVPARHDGRRHGLARETVQAMGFVVSGSHRTYFTGDTDLFPEMAAAVGRCDVALVAAGGWGPGLGAGHLDAARAAEVVGLVDARSAVPIHYGTLWPIGLNGVRPGEFHHPGRDFADHALRLAPRTSTHVLRPGQSVWPQPVP